MRALRSIKYTKQKNRREGEYFVGGRGLIARNEYT